MSHTRPHSKTLWEEGHETGRRVVALAVAVSLSTVALDLAVQDHLSALFDLVFVALCVSVALLVRPRDFFVVGVLPPLLMMAVTTTLALTDRSAIARADDGLVQAVVSGLSRHSLALGVGYALCLGVLGLRDRYTRGGVLGFGVAGLTRTGSGLPRRPAGSPGPPPTSRRRWSAPRGSRRPR